MTLFWDNGITRFHQGDARSIPLPDRSVHCVVTSPPYWGLRDYQLPTTVWGGDPACGHAWETVSVETEVGRGNWSQATNGRGESQPGGLKYAREPIPGGADTGSCAICGAWRGSLGLEPDAGQYIGHLSQVFEEVHRVLRGDGVFWVNIGDSHSDGHLAGIPERLALALQGSGWVRRQTVVWDKDAPMPESVQGTRWERCRVKTEEDAAARHDQPRGAGQVNESNTGRRRQKNDDHIDRRKVGFNDRYFGPPIPPVNDGHGDPDFPEGRFGRGREDWRLGANPGRPQQDHDGPDFLPSAQWTDCPGCVRCEANDGYVLRRGSWRCTTGHEYIYMFTKEMGYYSDGVPVATPLRPGAIARAAQNGGHPRWDGNHERQSTQTPQTMDISKMAPKAGANRRSVWRDIRPERYRGDHYAVFPSDLPRLCIQCSTSEAGVCPSCGSQWARVVHKKPSTMNIRVRDAKKGISAHKSWFHTGATGDDIASYGDEEDGETETVSWRPTCGCDDTKPIPATVLDPFAGTGTTCLAAQRLGRRSVGVDLSAQYLDQAVRRLSETSLPLILPHGVVKNESSQASIWGHLRMPGPAGAPAPHTQPADGDGGREKMTERKRTGITFGAYHTHLPEGGGRSPGGRPGVRVSLKLEKLEDAGYEKGEHPEPSVFHLGNLVRRSPGFVPDARLREWVRRCTGEDPPELGRMDEVMDFMNAALGEHQEVILSHPEGPGGEEPRGHITPEAI